MDDDFKLNYKGIKMNKFIAAVMTSLFAVTTFAQAPAKPAEKKEAPKAEVKKDEKKK